MLFRKRLYSGFVVILFITSLIFSSLRSSPLVYAANGDAQWGKSTASGATASTYFSSIAVDSDGSTYHAGYMSNGSVGLGNGVTVSVEYAGSNLLLAKYNSSGQAQWAVSTAAGTTATSSFTAVELDADGNIYVAGSVQGAGDVNFGNGVSLNNWYFGNPHAFLVKYNSSGAAVWARLVDSLDSGHTSSFSNLSIDSEGSVYAVGQLGYAGIGSSYDFGNGVTINSELYYGGLIVKYNSQGLAQWAKSVPFNLATQSYFSDIVLDSNFNSYIVGYLTGSGTVNLGNGVTVFTSFGGACECYFNNVLLAKYNSLGEIQWARSTVDTTLAEATFSDIKLDGDNNIYIVGGINGQNSYDFGNGVTATGSLATGGNPILIKYSNAGTAQWVKTIVLSETSGAYFYSLDLDSNSNIYIIGTVGMTGTYGFGNGVNFSIDMGIGETAPFLIKYDNTGNAQNVRSVTSGVSVDASFTDLAVDSNANTYVTGYVYGTGELGFGNSISIVGGLADSNNLIALKYEGNAPSPTATQTPTPTPVTTGSSSSPAPDGQRSTTDTPVCSDQVPDTPDLFQVTSIGRSSALVHFAPASDPVSSYLISFGESPEAEGYSAQLDLGHVDGAVTYTLDFLKPSTIYYAKVRAGNGCMPGDWSRTIRFQTSTQASYFPGQYSPIQSAQVFGAVNQKPSSSKVVPTKLQTSKKSVTQTAIPTRTSTFSKPWYQFW